MVVAEFGWDEQLNYNGAEQHVELGIEVVHEQSLDSLFNFTDHNFEHWDVAEGTEADQQVANVVGFQLGVAEIFEPSFERFVQSNVDDLLEHVVPPV